ncbi:MAG TPA: hypothetical protein VNG13_01495 [Mycobacteriales bacterium]|nr:hypothetical protein [Mycobacteriales bacterium]
MVLLSAGIPGGCLEANSGSCAAYFNGRANILYTFPSLALFAPLVPVA